MLRNLEPTPLHLARVELPGFHPEAPGSCDVFAFVVRDDAEVVLVDTGVGSGNDLIDRLYRPRRTDLATALLGAGTSIDDVTAVVNSHLHFDHCGNNRLFADVPIFVQEAEWGAARGTGYTVAEWVVFPGARYEPVRGRHRITPHLELIPTPGHTPGHQSLLVHTDDGLEIVVAQAAYTAAEFEAFRVGTAAVPDGTDLPDAHVASLVTLLGMEPRRARFSHDPRVWRPPA